MPRELEALVIDSDPATRGLMRRVLDDILGGCHVVAVDNATTAISLIESHRFDLIVSDYHLGATTGGDVLMYLRKSCTEITRRFVFFSGADEPIEMHDLVIDKGIRVSQLEADLRRLVPDLWIDRPLVS
jgi:CheY-like chemotaxis protein